MTDMTQAPTPGPLWMMHVIGPDDIYPAPDRATAVEWCAELNASMSASDVLCVAVPAIWIGTPEAHAEGLSEAVEGWTSPRQRLAPTAPVEASGSEPWTELSCDEQIELATRIAANVGYVLTPEPDHPDCPHSRPQPSGETREAVSALMRKPLAAVTSLDGTVKMPLVCLSVEERDAILAALKSTAEQEGGE